MTNRADERDPSAAKGLARIGGLLRLPGVGPYYASRMVSAIGTWSEQLATGWLVWSLTESSAWLGAIAFLRLAPALVAGPLGGVLSDRMMPLTLMRWCKLGVVAGMALLCLLLWADRLSLAALAVLVTWIGTLQALSNPANKAFNWHLVPHRWLAVAIPVGSITFNVAAFIGPALAGWIIATQGVAFAYLLTLAFQAQFACLLWRLRVAPRKASGEDTTPPRGVLRSLADGFGYVRRDPPIRAVLALHLTFSVCARPLIPMMPAIAALVFAGGAETMGALTAAMGGGAILGGLWLARRGRAAGLTALLLGYMLALMALLASLAQTATPAVGLALMAGIGWCMIVRASGTQTLLQFAVDDGMRGRVMGLYGLCIRAGSAVGAVAIGVLADLASFRAALTFAAVIGVVAVAALGRSFLRGGRQAEVKAQDFI